MILNTVSATGIAGAVACVVIAIAGIIIILIRYSKNR